MQTPPDEDPMPHFIDIHHMSGVTADAVAKAHVADLATQAKYGVNYVKYWVNESQGRVFCYCSAPNAEAANQAHREAHGQVAERLIEVDPDVADGFLGGGTVAVTGAVLAPNSQDCDTGVRTIVFTDIVGSTAMTQRLGDKAAMAFVEVHDGIVRKALESLGGREVKHLGDGIMAAFVSAVQAVRCASKIRAEFVRHAADHADTPVQIRIGIDSGEPVERHGDFFGSTVQLAARLCARAEPGQVLVSTSVVEQCKAAGLGFQDIGEVVLKGFERPVRAHAVSAG
jgi:class 3 adenylate cyclase